MSRYDEAMGILVERFGKDSLIAIATTDGERMYNRVVDALYEDGAFYISTNALSNKMKQIEAHPEVAVCANSPQFSLIFADLFAKSIW